MNKKGYTLVEMLMTGTIIVIIVLITVPNVINIFKETKNNEYNRFLGDVFISAEAYVQKYSTRYPELKKVNGKVYVYFTELINSGFLKSTTYDTKNKKLVRDEDFTVEITYNEDLEYDYKLYEEKINKSIKITGTKEYIKIGESLTLGIETVNMSNTGIEWTSSDESKATVENGVITGISNGTVEITATLNGISDTITMDIYKKYSITNLIENGSFEDGISGWFNLGSNTAQSSTTLKKYGSKSFQVIVNNANVFARYNYSDTINTLAGHKIYSRVDTLRDSTSLNPGIYNITGSTSDNWPSTNKTVSGWYTYSGKTGINVWEQISVYSEAEYNYLSVMLAQEKKEVSGNIYFDGLAFIDLTETFGEGNEPTKEWCDKNIGWFDGTTTIWYK